MNQLRFCTAMKTLFSCWSDIYVQIHHFLTLRDAVSCRNRVGSYQRAIE